MRTTADGNFFQCDNAVVQLLREIKGRAFSRAEAYLSFSKDMNCGKKWTISGYAKTWGWSRNKVRKFTSELLSFEGQGRDSRGTEHGHPIHVIVRANSQQKDRTGTEQGQNADTTIRIEEEKKKSKAETPPKPLKKKYSDLFENFWKLYPNKNGKSKAFESWKRNNFSNGLFEKIMKALEQQKKSKQWLREGGKYIPHGSTWVTGKRWEDEGQEESEWQF